LKALCSNNRTMEGKEQSYILNKILEVETKSRVRLIIAVLISLSLTIITVVYSINLDKTKYDLEVQRRDHKVVTLQYAELVTKQDSLISVIDSLLGKNAPIKDFTIFFHYRWPEQQEKSKQLELFIENRGFKIAAFQKVDRNFSNSIRYFHREDLAAASELYKLTVQFFKENNFDSDKINLAYFGNTSAKKGQIEIWIDP
jgi:hypothetical protein